MIHQKQCFDENVRTIKEQRVHERVDTPESRMESGQRVERVMPLFCEQHGLAGKADVVEFLEDGTPCPVEYKHGKRHAKTHDDLPLAAQALCLEEMLGKPVNEGAIDHHKSHRRRIV